MLLEVVVEQDTDKRNKAAGFQTIFNNCYSNVLLYRNTIFLGCGICD